MKKRVLVLLLLTSAAVFAADSLPSRISDADFWQFIQDASESSGTFETENWVSNETGIQNVIPQLQALLSPGGVYLGVGPEQNFTYIAAYAAARSDDGVFRNTLQTVRQTLLDQHRFALTSEDLTTLERIVSVFRQSGPGVDYDTGGRRLVAQLPSYSALMTARDETGRQQSFLASEDNYRVVRDLQLKNLVIPVTGDFAGPKTVRSVGRYLKDHEATVGAFYVSNVEGYLFRTTENRNGGAKSFYDNVATMPLDSRSTFIRSGSGGPMPPGGIPFTGLASMQQILEAIRNGGLDDARPGRTLGLK